MIDPETVKLGKKLGVVEDRRTFRLGSLLLPDAPTPPPRNRVGGAATFPLYRNDEYGDCTCVARAHQIIAQERSVGQSRKITITDEDVLKAYSDVTGFDPDRPETDNGAYMLDVLNYSRRIGIGREKDGTPHMIDAFARVSERAVSEVKLAHWMFGGLYVGAGLPISSAGQMGGVWHPVGIPERDEWGSWGGHAMYMVAYDQSGVTFSTWGQEQMASWEWWIMYVDEVYAVMGEDFLRTKTQKTPQGFNADRLAQQLAAL